MTVANKKLGPQASTDGFPAMEVAERIPRLRKLMGSKKNRLDGLLVTNLVNVRYLTGFTGSAAMLLVGPDAVLFVTDGRYRFQSAEQLAATGVDADIEVGVTMKDQRRYLRRAAKGMSRLGLEAGTVTWAQQRLFDKGWFTGADLVPTENLVEGLRRVKDEGEVARMARAAGVADQALAEVRHRLTDLPTEAEFALELDFAMRRLGADGPSFDTIVASGPNGAKPHHHPTDRRIEAGELIVLDFGALVDGYCSDMTRTLCVGEPTDPTTARMVEVVAASQAAGVKAVRDGIDAEAVDKICRDVIAEADWEDAFMHGTGHGVGLDIHEAPRLGKTSKDKLRTGNVVTVEPGVYLPDHGGVRIEDTMVVTDDGCTVLTNAPKDLVVA